MSSTTAADPNEPINEQEQTVNSEAPPQLDGTTAEQQEEENPLVNNTNNIASASDVASPPQRAETMPVDGLVSPGSGGAGRGPTPSQQQQQSQQPTSGTSTPPPHQQPPVPLRQNSLILPGATASARVKQPTYNRGEQTHSTIAELSEAFRMFTNVNGIVPQSVISQKDLTTVLQQTGMRHSEKDVASFIQTIDQNQLGNISFDEFASLMGRSVPIDEVDSLQAAFHSIDKNGTGVVSSAAFAELMANYGEHSSPDEVSEMLAFADPNNTGKVNYRVFLRMLGLRLR